MHIDEGENKRCQVTKKTFTLSIIMFFTDIHPYLLYNKYIEGSEIMNKDKINELIKQGRQMLKPNWDELNPEETPKGRKEEYPSIVKDFD